ncbi:MAG: efflux RND transporter periplasmic adaptor subunit [Myxococcota bacterium]
MKSNTRAAASGLVLLLALLAACGGEKAVEEVPAKSVVLAPVSVRDVEERVAATGQLLAKQRADVAAQVGGEITRILVDEGESVADNTVVIEIDPDRRKIDLDRARARAAEASSSLAEAERQNRRVQELAAKDIASRAQQDQAKTNLEGARSRLQAAQADLGAAERATADSRVTTRFAGVIGRRFVSRGEFVQPGQKLFELVSLDPVEVEFSLPESDASRLALGLPLAVTVAPYPGEVFHATVSMISPVVDERTRTLRVKALLPNPDGRLRPGLFARADLGIAKREDVVLVPEEAVLQRADGAVVFVASDGATRVERRVVQLARIKDGQAEIASGIGAGDRVVVRGHAALTDGERIIARNADGTPVVASSTAQPESQPKEAKP